MSVCSSIYTGPRSARERRGQRRHRQCPRRRRCSLAGLLWASIRARIPSPAYRSSSPIEVYRRQVHVVLKAARIICVGQLPSHDLPWLGIPQSPTSQALALNSPSGQGSKRFKPAASRRFESRPVILCTGNLEKSFQAARNNTHLLSMNEIWLASNYAQRPPQTGNSLRQATGCFWASETLSGWPHLPGQRTCTAAQLQILAEIKAATHLATCRTAQKIHGSDQKKSEVYVLQPCCCITGDV